MKTTLSILIVSFCSTIPVFGQHYIRTNTLGYIYGNPGIAYEYVVQDKLGVSMEVNFNLFQWTQEDINGEYRGIRLTPECRFYLRGEKGGEDRVFDPYLGAYYQIRRESYDSNWSYQINDSTSGSKPTETTMNSDAFGLLAGAKIVPGSAFYMDYGFGFGPYLNYEERKRNPLGGDDAILKDINFEKADLRRIHLKVHFAIGFRF